MNKAKRVLLALAMVTIDGLLFVIPLVALLAAYILIVRPPRFREWVLQLYQA